MALNYFAGSAAELKNSAAKAYSWILLSDAKVLIASTNERA